MFDLSFGPISLVLMSFILYLQYGKNYGYDTPVKLLDKLLYQMPQSLDEQIVVLSQVVPHIYRW